MAENPPYVGFLTLNVGCLARLIFAEVMTVIYYYCAPRSAATLRRNVEASLNQLFLNPEPFPPPYGLAMEPSKIRVCVQVSTSDLHGYFAAATSSMSIPRPG